MMKKAIVLCAVLLSILLVSAPLAAFADGHKPLQDPGFEDRLPADEGGWILFEDSRFSSARARNGRHSIFNSAFSRTVPFPPFVVGNVSGSYQEFPAAPGSRWRLTGYGFVPVAIDGGPAFGVVQVSFFDAKGKDLGTVETADNKTARAKISNEVNSTSPVGEWIYLDTGVATAPDGTATVQAFTLYVDFSASEIGQGVFFDDLNLCAVPDDDEDGSGCD